MRRERLMISKRLIPTIVGSILTLSAALPVMAAQNYTEALDLSTRFFGAQRCGDNQSWIHDECHWVDASLSAGGKTVDLSGGWHDCGDHVKFGQTNSFAAGMMLHSYLNFGAVFEDNYSPAFSEGNSNGIPDILDEVKYHTDYLLKTLVGDRLYYQVSSADVDHNSIAEPNFQSDQYSGGEGRQAFWVEVAGASNIAGSNAAVLAMMSVAYREFDDDYADDCLDVAKKMYEFGDEHHETTHSLDSYWELDSTYMAGTWEDDMAWGAIELFNATGESKYRDVVPSFLNTKDIFPKYFAPDYTNCAAFAAYSFDKYTGTDTYKEKILSEVENFQSAYPNDFGMTIFDTWGSIKYAAAASYEALLYYSLDSDNSSAFSFAKDNIDFILGDHEDVGYDAPSGFSFVVGYGNDHPDEQVHHNAAAGLQTRDSVYGQWHDEWYDNKHTLEGAVVGGPTAEDGGYYNRRDNTEWEGQKKTAVKSNEVCIYYNAPFVAAVAALELLESADSKNYPPSDITLSNAQISSGQAAGAVVGALKAIDINTGDSHTFSLVSGGSDFEIDGSSLVTKEKLSTGSFNVTVRASDGDDSYEKEFSITVIESETGDNLLYELGWYSWTNGYGSSVNGKDGDNKILNDGVVNVDFDIIAEDSKKNVWPGAAIEVDSFRVTSAGEYSFDDGDVINYSGIDYIVLEYKSNQDFKFVLPLSGTKDDDYFKLLTSTNGALVTDTIMLDESMFAQDGFGNKVSFSKSKMYKFRIVTDFTDATGSFEIETILIDGIKPGATPILSGGSSGKTLVAPLISTISASTMQLEVPQSGYYNIDFFSVSGQLVMSLTSELQAGVVNRVNWNGASVSSQMLLVRISGMGMGSTTNKVVLQ